MQSVWDFLNFLVFDQQSGVKFESLQTLAESLILWLKNCAVLLLLLFLFQEDLLQRIIHLKLQF